MVTRPSVLIVAVLIVAGPGCSSQAPPAARGSRDVGTGNEAAVLVSPSGGAPATARAPATAPAPESGLARAADWPPLLRLSLTAPRPTGPPGAIELPRVLILRQAPGFARGSDFGRGAPRLALLAHEVGLNGRRVGPVPFPAAGALELRRRITEEVERARGRQYAEWSRRSRAAGEQPEHTRYPIELFADRNAAFGRVWEVLKATYHVDAGTCDGRVFLAAVQPSLLGSIGPHEVDLIEHLAFVCGRPARVPAQSVVEVAVSATGVTVGGRPVARDEEQPAIQRALARARGRRLVPGRPVVLAVRAAAEVPWARVLRVVRALPYREPDALVYLRGD